MLTCQVMWTVMTSCHVHSECVPIEKGSFLIRGQKALGPKIWTQGCKSPQKSLLGSRWIHRHPYYGVLWEKCRFFNLVPKDLGPKIWPQGPNHLKTNCWSSGKSINTHIVGVIVRKVQIFEFGAKRPLGPKFGPGGPNHLKTDCWGPGKSIDAHIVGFCDKSADFWIWHQSDFGPKIWPWGS